MVPGDPGYDPEKCRWVTIMFNGAVQNPMETGRAIITADEGSAEEPGEIVFHKIDEHGHIEIDYQIGDCATFSERGRVSILFLSK